MNNQASPPPSKRQTHWIVLLVFVLAACAWWAATWTGGNERSDIASHDLSDTLDHRPTSPLLRGTSDKRSIPRASIASSPVPSSTSDLQRDELNRLAGKMRKGSLRGRFVVPPNAPPLNNAVLRTYSGGTLFLTLRVKDRSASSEGTSHFDLEGHFHVTGIPVGDCTMKFQADGYPSMSFRLGAILPDSETLVPPMELAMSTVVHGTLRLPVGHEPLDYRLYAKRRSKAAGPRYITTAIDTDGIYKMLVVLPGEYTLFARKTNSAISAPILLVPINDSSLVIKEGARERRHDLELALGGQILIAPTDKRLPPARSSSEASTKGQSEFGAQSSVRVIDDAGETVASYQGVHRNGDYLKGALTLRPGRYTGQLTLPDGHVVTSKIELHAGESKKMTFDERDR